MSRDIIWQPGHVAKESITATADGLGDGQETSGHGDCVIVDKLVPFDLCARVNLLSAMDLLIILIIISLYE